MKIRTDFEGKRWVTGNHKWVPVFPIGIMVKCAHCGRIAGVEDIQRGGLTKCLREIR